MSPEEWLKQYSEADAVSAEWGSPIPCEFCGTPTEITYFACTFGPEHSAVYPIFENACFGCARVKQEIRKLPPTRLNLRADWGSTQHLTQFEWAGLEGTEMRPRLPRPIPFSASARLA